MIKRLISLADFLDSNGLSEHANYVDKIIKSAGSYSEDETEEYSEQEPLRVFVGEPLRLKVPNSEPDYELVEEIDERPRRRKRRSLAEPPDGHMDPFYPDDEEYRFGVRGPHTQDLDIYDFFPGYSGSRDQLLEDLRDVKSKEYSEAMSHFEERVTGEKINQVRRMRFHKD